MKWLNNLKAKWNIQSNFQLVIIFIVFGITGTLSVEVGDPILDFIGLKKEVINPWIFIPLKILLIFPVYQILILIIGTIFGQFKFFWEFEKKMLSKMGFSRFFN
mgnify:FL=1|jgi:hypothetical protein|tara:strand:- start:2499 stop:2810 length:312 start_codon:yes stop_codon:yes gene_type:complete